MKFPASLNFEFAGWLFDLALITDIRSSPLPTGQNPESARVEKLLGAQSHTVPRDIRVKNPCEESVDKRKGKSHLNFNLNGSARHYHGRTYSDWNNDYYSEGPNKRKQHKEHNRMQSWRASIAKADPCNFKPSTSVSATSFDPLELEVQASNHRNLEHKAGVFSQLEADDEAEISAPSLGIYT
ncbi:hypothetical protein KY290_035034 [Solanum tuberosum]|uniref:Integrase core domain containing protein n=1 Tax=Solanum tuberosum TaxID=4113 RepID=A0ABQ7U6L5_SOLTU|nr:hypothetical protein KY289_034509 [Solanum tuberosum]KAH0646362.1 hypothetical protein KY284_034246 [Solanum tuberosum]KAH0649061.1 hypothetical protein KY285_034309 [Solanum tuberosum]KAH0741991.1 hypothetical protein KY290_035034 [Solanum tuberosum]